MQTLGEGVVEGRDLQQHGVPTPAVALTLPLLPESSASTSVQRVLLLWGCRILVPVTWTAVSVPVPSIAIVPVASCPQLLTPTDEQ